jgi:hypothetical protein
MCLYDPKAEKKPIKKNGWRWCYKVLECKDGKRFSSPLMPQSPRWRPGFVKSNRISPARTRPERRAGVINRGIHVGLTRASLISWTSSPQYLFSKRIIVRVRCYNKDLIGRNNTDAVYMKVYLPKQEFDRALVKVKQEFAHSEPSNAEAPIDL